MSSKPASALVVIALVASTIAASSPPSDAGVPSCIRVSTASRYVPYGYDHVVFLASVCPLTATCAVTTDVNPTPSVVEVPPRQTVEVLTFRGSPASSFVAHVACEMHPNRSRATK